MDEYAEGLKNVQGRTSALEASVAVLQQAARSNISVPTVEYAIISCSDLFTDPLPETRF